MPQCSEIWTPPFFLFSLQAPHSIFEEAYGNVVTYSVPVVKSEVISLTVKFSFWFEKKAACVCPLAAQKQVSFSPCILDLR